MIRKFWEWRKRRFFWYENYLDDVIFWRSSDPLCRIFSIYNWLVFIGTGFTIYMRYFYK